MFIPVSELLDFSQMNAMVRWELTQLIKICKAMQKAENDKKKVFHPNRGWSGSVGGSCSADPWVTKDRGLWFLENLTERFQEEIQHDEP